MKSRIRMKSVTFGPEFPKPSGRRGTWPFIEWKTDELWLEDGHLFVMNRQAPDHDPTKLLMYDPSCVEMHPFWEDVGLAEEPKLAVAGKK